MKRQHIAVLLMLTIGLQGSMAAFASASPLMPTGCQTVAKSHSEASEDACCPKGHHAVSCCLDLCLTDIGVTLSPSTLVGYARTTPVLLARTAIFFSRGDSPLIRPPIL